MFRILYIYNTIHPFPFMTFKKAWFFTLSFVISDVVLYASYASKVVISVYQTLICREPLVKRRHYSNLLHISAAALFWYTPTTTPKCAQPWAAFCSCVPHCLYIITPGPLNLHECGISLLCCFVSLQLISVTPHPHCFCSHLTSFIVFSCLLPGCKLVVLGSLLQV